GPLDRGPGGVGGALAAAAPGAYIELRSPDGDALVSAPTRGAFTTSRPRLPEHVSGLSSSGDESQTFFNVASAQGSGEVRVRGERLRDGSVLMVALPLDDVNSTLHRLLFTEIFVTAAVLLGAVGLGLWLVRVGLRPLRNIEGTAAEIAGGELSSRVPGTDERPEGGPPGTAPNTLLHPSQDPSPPPPQPDPPP